MSLPEILQRIHGAAEHVDRPADSVTLVAVSKQQPPERVDAVLALGQRVFGENRVQEAQERWAERRRAVPDLELRLVGPLQSNKVKDAVSLFDVIETLDREKLARSLADAAMATGEPPRLYVQVNTGEEPQKAGVSPTDADAFLRLCRDVYDLKIEGLMAIPPAEQPAGPHFALLASIAERSGLSKLSMGMSADFELAIHLGATSVRVGAAIFGERMPRSVAP